MKRLESVKLVQFLLYEQQEFRLAEITGLFGRNGSGKSSLLHLIAGDLQPSAGSVLRAGATIKVPRG